MNAEPPSIWRKSRRWCRHAGLPAPVAFRSTRGPLVRGAVDLAPVEVNRSGRPGLPYSHVELRFAEPVQGPVVIGARAAARISACAYRSNCWPRAIRHGDGSQDAGSASPAPNAGVRWVLSSDQRARSVPWQARLAAQIADTEEWPVEVGVPTGLGKTACLDIAVWWLASQADRAPARRTAPTRIWWVVNRRLLVDSTSEHAEAIGKALRDASTQELVGRSAEVVAAVADRLRALSADPTADPLEVIRLRGGITSRRPMDPSRPAVMLSTLPMYGSRLLFRGYGTTRSMRPIDAAVAGNRQPRHPGRGALGAPPAGVASRARGVHTRCTRHARRGALKAERRGADGNRRCRRSIAIRSRR